MENQHRKIKGYRELSQLEIDLMNKAKALGEEFCDLIEEIEVHVGNQERLADEVGGDELARVALAEPAKWLRSGKQDIQTGLMKVVRSVAQPTSF